MMSKILNGLGNFFALASLAQVLSPQNLSGYFASLPVIVPNWFLIVQAKKSISERIYVMQSCFRLRCIGYVWSFGFKNHRLFIDRFVIRPKKCVDFLHKSMQHKADDVIDSIEGFVLTEAQKWRILKIPEHLTYLDNAIKDIDEKLNELVEPYEINYQFALHHSWSKTRLCHHDYLRDRYRYVTVFFFRQTLRVGGSYTWQQSNRRKKKSVKITRAGVYLKPCLVQVAHAAVKCKDVSYYRIKYERISKRRGKKRAIIAIARMILTAIYHMFKTGEMWNPVDFGKIDMLVELKKKQIKENTGKAIKFLQHQNILPEDFSIGIHNSA